MSSRTQHDSVIDDDDELCPLCIEELDLSDKNFKPCPCGYQICQFCYNNIKIHSEEGRCPNCRRVYDESSIEYRVPDADEFKADLALKHRKAAAAKKKETEKREIEASSRKNLAGVRVVQKNLVYVIGLNPSIRDESQLLQTLRGEQYFGQYGDIEKIVVSKAKPGGNANQGIGVYVTFARKADAATCIAAVDGSPNGDRVLRAQYGTTKYCSSFLRNDQCSNRNCTFLHETGDDSDSFTRQDLSSINTLSSQRFHPGVQSTGNQQPPPHPHPQSRQAHSHAQAGPSGSASRQLNAKDESATRVDADGSALPSSASWANKDSHVQRARRASMTASRGTPSPKSGNASVASKSEDAKADKRPQQSQTSAPQDSQAMQTPGVGQSPKSQSSPGSDLGTQSSGDVILDNLVKAITSPDFRFVFSTSGLVADEVAPTDNYPSMIDPYGGVKRRAMREKADQERVKQEADGTALLQPNPLEDENPESGSSQLGGEPDEAHAGSASAQQSTTQQSHDAIQPPPQPGPAAMSGVGSPLSSVQQFQNLNLNGRTMTPQQQQQLMLKGASGQQAGLVDQLPTNTTVGAFDHNPLARAGSFPNQTAAMGGVQGHARQSSRFSFANDSGSKNPNNQRMVGQQSSVMQASSPNPLATPSAQHGLGSQYFASGVQGPPPGLKTAGAPPVSGGGMFAKGHGFTSQMNNNLGLNPEGNADLMRELMRGRSGNSGAGAQQAPEAPKREFMSPFLQQHNTPPPVAPVSGLLGSVYGRPPGTYHEPGRQKQKKRGKKHRHANTSSGGGGVVDLADPSILQARMHQGGGANAAAAATAAGQGLYGSQGQATDEDFPPLAPPMKHNDQSSNRFPSPFKGLGESPIARRSGTPSVLPGSSLPHAHPTAELPRDASTASPTPQPPGPASAIRAPPGLTNAGNIGERSVEKTSTSEESAPAAAPATDDNTTTETPNRSRATKSKMSEHTPERPSVTSVERAEQKPKDEAPATPAARGAKVPKDTPAKKPNKLDTSVPDKSRDSSPSKGSARSQSEVNVGPSAANSSRPDTPASAVSRTTEPSTTRQPKVLRVVETSKPEFPSLPPAAAPSETSTPVAKQRSRRTSQSQSSVSRPTTPPEVGSEYTSASASRANSPAPNRVGSAPVRAVSKNQVKKDRKQKAKQAEVTKEDMASTAAAEEPVQAPIMGRKRKAKKASAKAPSDQPSAGTSAAEVDDEKNTKRQAAPSKDGNKKDVVPQKQAKTEATEPWRSNNTLEQLIADAEATGTNIKDLFVERTSSLPAILGQLHQSCELDLNIHPLFNSPPPSNQRVDMKCAADDYEVLKNPVDLTSEHRKQLLRGEPVRISSDSDLLKERCLITPGGCVLRHLSAEEEDRYLALEKNLASATDSRLEYPALAVDEPDPTNCGGGLDALFATPEKFCIRWVDEAPQSSLMTGAANEAAIVRPTSSSHPETETARAPTTPSAADSQSRAAPSKIIPAGPGYGTFLDELTTMREEELRIMIDLAQRDLDVSRKEADSMDKKMSALVKRNKKLVQHALAASVDAAVAEGKASA